MAIQEKFPSIRPSLNLDFANTKTLDPRITFRRASTGAFYDGKTVAKAEENLLTYSQEFDNAAWGKNNCTVTANAAVAPDGTLTAERMVEDTMNAPHILSQSLSLTGGTSYTFSFFVKPSGRGVIHAQIFSGTAVAAVDFNITSGLVISTTVGSGTIANVGNGWYRCSISGTALATGVYIVRFYPLVGGTPNYTGDGTSGLYVWGAQLEQRSTATAYTPTTTQPITNYIPVLQTAAANVARFDHNPITGESLGLLIEEQRTNLVLRSEEFNDAYWNKTRSSIAANSIVAPDGTLTADKLVEDAVAGSHCVLRTNIVTPTIGQVFTGSVYVKAAERSSVALHVAGSTGNASIVNLVDGTVTSGPAVVTSAGNGWWKISLSYTAPSVSDIYLEIDTAIGTAISYTGDGYSGIYIWGAQLEVGAFPTSYIKTEASQVTRDAEHANMMGTNFSSWYRRDEWALFAEFSITSTNTQRTIAKFEGNSCQLSLLVQNNGQLWGGWFNSGDVSTTYFYTKDKIEKAAILFSNNPFQYSIVAGGTVGSSGQELPLNVASANQLRIGNFNDVPNTRRLNGYIRKLAFYPARLTNAQLQALTT